MRRSRTSLVLTLCSAVVTLVACEPAVTTPDAAPTPSPAAARFPVTGFALAQVATGFGTHTCGVAKGGRAYCWGANSIGQLGDGTYDSDSVPVAVAGGSDFTTVSAGAAFTCGLSRGAALCWGDNFSGQLGDGGVVQNSALPVAVAGGHSFVALDAGYEHACAVTSDQRTLCWGGIPFTSGSNAPVAVAGAPSLVALSVGNRHACGLTRSGQAHCWGDNSFGQLGDGTIDPGIPPVPVAGGLVFTAISAGGSHSCGLTKGGAMWCWGGQGVFGELGNGGNEGSLVPVPVSGGYAFTALSAGTGFTCGVVKEGQLFCWGANNSGQLGNGTMLSSNVPVAVGGMKFTSVSADGSYACGVTKDLGTWCWGANSAGNLGDGTTIGRSAPGPVSTP